MKYVCEEKVPQISHSTQNYSSQQPPTEYTELEVNTLINVKSNKC